MLSSSLAASFAAAPPRLPGAALPGDERDIAFDADDFQRVRAMIREKAGIDLHPGKQNMVYGRLSRRLRECNVPTFRQYLDRLAGASAADREWQEFINCLTTNLTAFFREKHHFDALADLLKQAPPGRMRIWSCASSTGEEPYSIAMTAAEAGGQRAVSVDASDIDSAVVATAKEGVYALRDAAEGLGEARLRRFFLRGSGPNEGKARVRPELRRMVEFRTFNLLSGAWPAEPYDAIFCRNVMIYFDRPTQRKVLEKLHGALKPGATLFVGHSENFTEHQDLFRLAGKTAYRKHG